MERGACEIGRRTQVLKSYFLVEYQQIRVGVKAHRCARGGAGQALAFGVGDCIATTREDWGVVDGCHGNGCCGRIAQCASGIHRLVGKGGNAIYIGGRHIRHVGGIGHGNHIASGNGRTTKGLEHADRCVGNTDNLVAGNERVGRGAAAAVDFS